MSAPSPAALTALAAAVADDRAVWLPPVRDRGTYVEIDRALTAMGGRWDPRERAWRFGRDPRPGLGRILGRDVAGPPSPGRDRQLSYWPTPPAMAALLIAGLVVPARGSVLEPSAGCGALVTAVRGARPDVWIAAVEVDPARAARIADADTVYATSLQGFAAHATARYDAVVANPPFTEPGDRHAWVTHLELAWTLLRPGGRLQMVAPASLNGGRQRRIGQARDLIVGAGGSWLPAPVGAFTAAGTGVRTVIVEATR